MYIDDVMQAVKEGKSIAFVGPANQGKLIALKLSLKKLSRETQLKLVAAGRHTLYFSPADYVFAESIESADQLESIQQSISQKTPVMICMDLNDPVGEQTISQLFSQRCSELELDPAVFSLLIYSSSSNFSNKVITFEN